MINNLTYSSFNEVWGEDATTETNDDDLVMVGSGNKNNNFHEFKINDYKKKIEVYKSEIEYLEMQIGIHKSQLNKGDKNKKTKKNKVPKKIIQNKANRNDDKVNLFTNIPDVMDQDDDKIDVIMIIITAIFTVLFISQIKLD